MSRDPVAWDQSSDRGYPCSCGSSLCGNLNGNTDVMTGGNTNGEEQSYCTADYRLAKTSPCSLSLFVTLFRYSVSPGCFVALSIYNSFSLLSLSVCSFSSLCYSEPTCMNQNQTVKNIFIRNGYCLCRPNYQNVKTFLLSIFFFSYLPHGSQQYFLFLSFFCQVPSPLVVSELINGARIDDYDDDVRRLILCNPNAPYCLYTPNHGALPLTEEDTTSRYLLSFIFLSLFLLNVLFFVLLSSFFLFFCRHELPLQCTQMPIPR